jgi:hypothetical protein
MTKYYNALAVVDGEEEDDYGIFAAHNVLEVKGFIFLKIFDKEEKEFYTEHPSYLKIKEISSKDFYHEIEADYQSGEVAKEYVKKYGAFMTTFSSNKVYVGHQKWIEDNRVNRL